MKTYQRWVISGFLVLASLGAMMVLLDGLSWAPLAIACLAGAAVGLRATALRLETNGHATSIRARALASRRKAKA